MNDLGDTSIFCSLEDAFCTPGVYAEKIILGQNRRTQGCRAVENNVHSLKESFQGVGICDIPFNNIILMFGWKFSL